MAVVAPLSASYPALTVAISLFSPASTFTALRVGGIVLILVGVVIVVRGEAAAMESVGAPGSSRVSPGTEIVKPSGIGAALISALGFGVLFWLLGNRVVPHVGFASAVWMIRLTSTVVTVIVIVAMRRPLALPRKSAVSTWLLAMGVLDTGAFVLNNLGMQIEQVSVVSVLSSLYGAVTVLLSSVILRERLSKVQWLGIVAIFGGITAISL